MQIQRLSCQRYSDASQTCAIADHFGSFPWPCFAIPFQRRASLVKAFSSHTQQRPSVTLLIQCVSQHFLNKAERIQHGAKHILSTPLPLISVPSCSHTVQSYPLSTLHLSTSLLPRYDSLLFRSVGQTALRLHVSFHSLRSSVPCLCSGFQRNATPQHFCSLPAQPISLPSLICSVPSQR